MYYYQQNRPRRQPSVVRNLIIANVVAFVIQIFLEPIMGGQNIRVDGGMTGYLSNFNKFFGYIPQLAIGEGYVWQFVTHMFLHGGLFHIFFNMFALYIFGPHVERTIGKQRFLILYLVAGLGAVLLQSLIAYESPRPMIGASGAVFGIAGGFAYFYPRSKLLVFGLIPVMTWKLIAFYAAAELLLTITAPGSFIAHAAHFGGIVSGLLLLQILYRKYSLGLGAGKSRSSTRAKPEEEVSAEHVRREKPKAESRDHWGKVIELEKDKDGWWK